MFKKGEGVIASPICFANLRQFTKFCKKNAKKIPKIGRGGKKKSKFGERVTCKACSTFFSYNSKSVDELQCIDHLTTIATSGSKGDWRKHQAGP